MRSRATTSTICSTRSTGCRRTCRPRWRRSGPQARFSRSAPLGKRRNLRAMSDTPRADRADVPILPAATILLLRDEPQFEVLMVKRHHQIDFASGALVFPGGKSHAGDHDPDWHVHTVGWEAYDAEQRAMRIAAIREVFEEAGILLARRRDGQPLSGEACPMDVRRAVD